MSPRRPAERGRARRSSCMRDDANMAGATVAIVSVDGAPADLTARFRQSLDEAAAGAPDRGRAAGQGALSRARLSHRFADRGRRGGRHRLGRVHAGQAARPAAQRHDRGQGLRRRRLGDGRRCGARQRRRQMRRRSRRLSLQHARGRARERGAELRPIGPLSCGHPRRLRARRDLTVMLFARGRAAMTRRVRALEQRSKRAFGESAVPGKMKILAGNSNRPLAEAIAAYLGEPLTGCHVRRFADLEIFVEILENVRGGTPSSSSRPPIRRTTI